MAELEEEEEAGGWRWRIESVLACGCRSLDCPFLDSTDSALGAARARSESC